MSESAVAEQSAPTIPDADDLFRFGNGIKHMVEHMKPFKTRLMALTTYLDFDTNSESELSGDEGWMLMTWVDEIVSKLEEFETEIAHPLASDYRKFEPIFAEALAATLQAQGGHASSLMRYAEMIRNPLGKEPATPEPAEQGKIPPKVPGWDYESQRAILGKIWEVSRKLRGAQAALSAAVNGGKAAVTADIADAVDYVLVELVDELPRIHNAVDFALRAEPVWDKAVAALTADADDDDAGEEVTT